MVYLQKEDEFFHERVAHRRGFGNRWILLQREHEQFKALCK